MVGLDTNVVLRYLLQDDPKQATLANHIFEQVLSDRNPGLISLVAILEIVWVLRSLLKQTPIEIASHLEHLLAADSLEIQNEQQVFEAAFGPQTQYRGIRRCVDRGPEHLVRLSAYADL